MGRKISTAWWRLRSPTSWSSPCRTISTTATSPARWSWAADVITEKPMTIDIGRLRTCAGCQEEDRQVDHRQLQLPLRAASHAGEGHPDVRRHRQDHRRRFPLVSRPSPRRRLFPPLAPLQGQVGRAAGPQGDPPFRPRQLVDRFHAQDHPRLRQARLLPPGDGRYIGPDRTRTALPRLPGRGALRLHARHGRARGAEAALPRRRKP